MHVCMIYVSIFNNTIGLLQSHTTGNNSDITTCMHSETYRVLRRRVSVLEISEQDTSQNHQNRDHSMSVIRLGQRHGFVLRGECRVRQRLATGAHHRVTDRRQQLVAQAARQERGALVVDAQPRLRLTSGAAGMS